MIIHFMLVLFSLFDIAGAVEVQSGINMDQFGELELTASNSRLDVRNKRNYIDKTYSNKNVKVVMEQIENVDQSYADSLRKLYLTELLGTYRNRKSPYTGESLSTVPCSSENTPEVHPVNYNSKEAEVLMLNASERNAFGVCQESLIQKKTIVFLGYDPKTKSFLNLKIFIPKNLYKKEMLKRFLIQFKGDIPL
jgi:hypothetical protein